MVSVKRLQIPAAEAVSQDDNLVRFLPHSKLSLLMSYLRRVNTLNQALQGYAGLLESTGFRRSPQERNIRKKVLDLAAGTIAAGFVLQEELEPYFDGSGYDTQKLSNEYPDRMEKIREEVLNPLHPLYKEQ